MRFGSLKWAAMAFAAALLLGACDPTALPVATPTATAIPATATTAPTLTTQPTDTPLPLPTPTGTAVSDANTSTPETSGLASPVATPTVNAALQAELEEVEADTSRLRGLQPKKPVPAHFISPEQLKQDMIQQMGEDYSHEEAKRDASVLWLLRLLDDPGIDLYQLQIDLLGEQVLGYYDNKKRELFVRAEQGGFSPLERETLAHELTHSLQDQYFDLQKVRPDDIENDRGTAVLAVIEGDAVITMLLYDQQYMTPDERAEMEAQKAAYPSDVANRTPPYILDSLYLPYQLGPTFLTALARAQPGSYKGINDALADPPESTEQVLHPEKFLRAPRETPVPVTVPPLTSTLGAGWTFQDSDTLGEFDFGEMLKINDVSDADTRDAAAGWGGARYAYYRNGGNSLIAVVTEWDTEKDAREFDTAMISSFDPLKKAGGEWTDGKRYFAMAMSGKRVVYACGTEQAAVQRALAAIK